MGEADVVNEDEAEASPDGPTCGSSKPPFGFNIPLGMAIERVGLEVREKQRLKRAEELFQCTAFSKSLTFMHCIRERRSELSYGMDLNLRGMVSLEDNTTNEPRQHKNGERGTRARREKRANT